VTRNDAQDFANRLYARVPANYRAYDRDQGEPLLALLQVIGEQAANLRQDLDALWDNFFIETCQDWVVPYIGALAGANLLANPVGRSNRLEVRDTVRWRRNKGTPAMLQTLAGEITGWPCELAEFFRALGWSQNVNHVRLDRPLTANVRDAGRLSLLGRAGDTLAHAADFRPADGLDGPRVTRRSLGLGRAGWGTPGRYQIRNVGFFVRRLQTFAIAGGTPAAVDPGLPPPAAASFLTFDPLHGELPLFVQDSGMPLTRAAFNAAPGQYFGADVGVRQFGVLLAGEPATHPAGSAPSRTPFTFGGVTVSIALDPNSGLRLIGPARFRLGANNFIIEAVWRQASSDTSLGALSTLLAARGGAGAFHAGATANGAGRLVLALQTGRTALGLNVPAAPAARFPGAAVAVRALRTGAPRTADACYVYLPPAFVRPGDRLIHYAADDGSTYGAADLGRASLLRAGEGQVHPAFPPTQSTTATDAFKVISRTGGALRIADPSRLAGAGVLIQAELFNGAVFQPQGAIANVSRPAASHPELTVPNPWPAFTFGPARVVPPADPGDATRLAVLLRPLSGNFIPSCELVVRSRAGKSLLVYLPQIDNAPATGVRVFVADDGSTWFAGGSLQLQSLFDRPARPATGQVLPIAGVWPLQYRRPVAYDLCRAERASLVQAGELGIDPELGRFAFAAGDPAIGQGNLAVDYATAFSQRVGALNYDRLLDPKRPATRLVSQFGDADTRTAPGVPDPPVHASVAAAVAAAIDGDVIEIIDSASYASSNEIAIGAVAVRNLTIRAAAGQRPALTFFAASGAPTRASFHVTAASAAMDSLELNGVLISGGPIIIERRISQLRLLACTLDPRFGISLLALRSDRNEHADYLLCRCVSGGIRAGPGVERLTIADSLVDQQNGTAIAGPIGPGSPPVLGNPPDAAALGAGSIQLERVTVLGRIYGNALSASESILDDVALVTDQQAGCIRFSRFEAGSVLPRRYQCIPSEAQSAQAAQGRRILAPVFNSRRFGRPDYAQLAAVCPPEILSASEQGSEIGAFATALNPVRVRNLTTKLQEFMPVGLMAVIIAET
jgi:hypothetical protein